MPESRLNELIQRLELVAKLGGLLKWIVLAIFGAGGWLALLQFEVQQDHQMLADIQVDRKEHIKASEEWHRKKDIDDATREQVISQLAKTQSDQKDLIMRLMTK